MKRFMPDPEGKLFHIMMGEPDDGCEICRAHGMSGHDAPGDGPGIVIMEIAPLDELLSCSCPLCRQIRPEPFGPAQGGPLE